ncbi:MAG: DUF1461 domain-containing protein [Nanoarchaeota archaeon]
MNEKNVIIVLFCIIFPLFLLLLSYKTVLFLTPLASGQQNVFQFLEGKSDLQSGFTELEVSHLEDVKKVMKYADYVFYILLLIVTTIITYYRKEKDFVLELLNYGGKVTGAVIIFVGVFALLFFDALFTLFHKIFFPQGNWIFAADSLLIHTFPLEFFVSISRNIFLVTLFLGIVFILSKHFFRHVRNHRH